MQAIRILKQYLSMEAKDKKGIGECSEAQGKHALVRTLLVVNVALLIAILVRCLCNQTIVTAVSISYISQRRS